MNNRNNNKRNNTICCLQENITPQHSQLISNTLQYEEEVTFQAHSLKMDLNKEEEDDLFRKVLAFIQLLFDDKKTWSEAKQHFSKYSKNESKIASEHKNQKLLSFKKMNFGSKICFDAEVTLINAKQNKKDHNLRRGSKKISILISEQQCSMFDQFDLGSNESSSEASLKTIRSIDINHMPMNIQTITAIYQMPQPFLINLSLCIFTRYCLSSRRKVLFEQSSWVLCVATIIAYKFYYDEQIQGLIDCFVGIMNISRKDLIDLQRCFLQEIDYITIVRNYDYYYMLNKLLTIKNSDLKSQNTKQSS